MPFRRGGCVVSLGCLHRLCRACRTTRFVREVRLRGTASKCSDGSSRCWGTSSGFRYATRCAWSVFSRARCWSRGSQLGTNGRWGTRNTKGCGHRTSFFSRTKLCGWAGGNFSRRLRLARRGTPCRSAYAALPFTPGKIPHTRRSEARTGPADRVAIDPTPILRACAGRTRARCSRRRSGRQGARGRAAPGNSSGLVFLHRSHRSDRWIDR